MLQLPYVTAPGVDSQKFIYIHVYTYIVLEDTPYVIYNHVHVGQKRVQKMET